MYSMLEYLKVRSQANKPLQRNNLVSSPDKCISPLPSLPSSQGSNLELLKSLNSLLNCSVWKELTSASSLPSAALFFPLPASAAAEVSPVQAGIYLCCMHTCPCLGPRGV